MNMIKVIPETQGRNKDFKLGGALKKIAPNGGRPLNLLGISCEKITILRQKIFFFFNFPGNVHTNLYIFVFIIQPMLTPLLFCTYFFNADMIMNI